VRAADQHHGGLVLQLQLQPVAIAAKQLLFTCWQQEAIEQFPSQQATPMLWGHRRQIQQLFKTYRNEEKFQCWPGFVNRI
jgi:hypothetical protein